MARWWVEYTSHDLTVTEQFDPLQPVAVLKKDDPSTFTCELALGDPTLTRDIIAPKATNFVLYRGDTRIVDGEVRSVNLAGERDTLLVDHADWLQYLDERIYPFHFPFNFGDWPIKWVGEDLTTIMEAILQAMMDEDPYVPPFIFSNSMTGITTNYQIDAGDATTVLGHAKALGERDDGFDFKAKRTDSGDIRFSMFHPKEDNGEVVYTITKDIGQIQEDGFEWTNEGPESTWTLGLGAGSAQKYASESTFEPSRAAYYRRDKVVNFNMRNYPHLERLTAAEGFRQRFPQKQLNLPVLVNTAHLPNFWAKSLGRPHSLLGKRIHVGPIDYKNYHTIDADFKILDMTISPDDDGNDFVTFGLDMING